MNNKRTFFQVNAPAGSGKTLSAISWAIEQAGQINQKTVIVLKSKRLMDEAAKTAGAARTKLGVTARITCINRDTINAGRGVKSAKSVRLAILNHLNGAVTGQGELLFITEAAFIMLADWPGRPNWHIVMDEIPTIATAHQLRLPDHHRLLTDHLMLLPSKPNYSRIIPTPGSAHVIRDYAENTSRDIVSAQLSAVAREICDPRFDVYALDTNYARVMDHDSLGGELQLEFYGLLKPTLFGADPSDSFASVTIMGAAFTDSLLYYIWSDLGVAFVEHPVITQGLRYRLHRNGHRLHIKYLFEQGWSKRFAQRSFDVGDLQANGLDLLVQAVREEFSGDFVYLVNKDMEAEIAPLFSNGTRLPNSTYGLNEYQHIHQAAILSALNSTPGHYRFLGDFGVNGEAAREAMYHQTCYQSIMRSSLRDPDATADVTVIVADMGAAESLRDMFPGCKVSCVLSPQVLIAARPNGRPPLEETQTRADIQRRLRQRKQRLTELHDAVANGRPVDLCEVVQLDTECKSSNQTMPLLKHLLKSTSCNASISNPHLIRLPVFASIESGPADAHWEVDIRNPDGFIQQLQEMSRTKLTEKRKNALISTTSFDASLSDKTKRGLANITRIWGTWLDIDGGTMPLNHIPKLLPYTRMAVFNSWTPGNYRIFIPTTSFMSITSYEQVIHRIVRDVERSAPDDEITRAAKEGRRPRTYVSKARAAEQSANRQTPNPVHGIDPSKLTPSSLFYLPAQSEGGEASSFFKDFNGPTRRPLNPEIYVNDALLDDDAVDEEVQRLIAESGDAAETFQSNGNQVSIDGIRLAEMVRLILAKYRAVPDGHGRHNAFFKAAWALHYRAGVPLDELQPHLQDCDYDGKQRDRYQQIITDLRSGRYAPRQSRNLAA